MIIKKYIEKELLNSELFIKFLRVQPDYAFNYLLRIKGFHIINVFLEISSACNLSCPLCPVGNKVVPPFLMSLEDYITILDLLPHSIRTIIYSNRGEPTINPNFAKMIKYARDKGFETVVSTNGMLLHKYIDELVEYGPDKIIIAVEGTTQEIHAKYRIGSDLEKIKDNIRQLTEARKKSKLKYPTEIAIQTLVNRYNEEQVMDLTEMAESLGVDKIMFKSLAIHLGSRSLREKSFQESFIPKNEDYRRKRDLLVCNQINELVILYNGDVSICASDFEGKYIVGNIIKQNGLENVIQGERYCHFKKKIFTRDLPICGSCPIIANEIFIPEISKSFADKRANFIEKRSK